jgi:hypothetical protein
MRLRPIATLASTLLLIASAACSDVSAPVAPTTEPSIVAPETPTALKAEDLQAGRTAWTFVANTTQPATGLATPTYPFRFLTVWDIGSVIGATWSAQQLGIITRAAYDARIGQILSTLDTLPLYDDAAFNKNYDATSGAMVDANRVASTTGFGWSATDVGRLLVWLRILAVTQPRFADRASAIVDRLDMSRIVHNGVLNAEDLDPATGFSRSYAETGLGYEQYAAAGYALWGYRARRALDATAHVRTVDILGVSVATDSRGTGRITSEPYLMMGLETGWYSSTLRRQALNVLAAQQARYAQTSIVTMLSEDAVPVAPYYFYYYSLYNAGRSFAVDGPDAGTFVDSPRWVSTKAAFAWRALAPSTYTLTALGAVQGAADPARGWGAGVYEGTLAPTGEPNINTAALVLESLAYRARGRAFLDETI